MTGKARNMRKTKIICTIGPSTDSEEMLKKLMQAGMNVARFNFSHGTQASHEKTFRRLCRVRRELGLSVASMLDTRGPEIRVRSFRNGKVMLREGDSFTLTTEDVEGDGNRVSVTYRGLPDDVKKGSTILIDDGLIGLRVNEVEGPEVRCTVTNGGPVSDHKGVNIPGADLSMPFISEQDRSDIEFGCRLGFDFISASFVRSAEDIREIRSILDAKGSKMKIIAKIESMQGIRNLKEIMREADGIMVARGDLGVEIPLEDVPVQQKKMIHLANEEGKLVVTATQMLDSMIHNPRPTRAEAADVANAIYDGTTAIMLSGETAAGAYPVEAVMTMARIAERTEKAIIRERNPVYTTENKADVTTAISHATCTVAADIQAKAIITVTISGSTAIRVSKYKPACPVIACTSSAQVACQLNLYFGVYPLLIPQEETSEMLFASAMDAAQKAGFVRKGDKVVITAGMPLGVIGNTNMINVRVIG